MFKITYQPGTMTFTTQGLINELSVSFLYFLISIRWQSIYIPRQRVQIDDEPEYLGPRNDGKDDQKLGGGEKSIRIYKHFEFCKSVGTEIFETI